MRTPAELAEYVADIFWHRDEPYIHKSQLVEDITELIEKERQYQAKLEAELESLEKHLAEKDLTLEFYKVLGGLSTPDHRKVFGLVEGRIKGLEQQLSQAEAMVKDKDEEIARLKSTIDKYINEVKYLFGRIS